MLFLFPGFLYRKEGQGARKRTTDRYIGLLKNGYYSKKKVKQAEYMKKVKRKQKQKELKTMQQFYLMKYELSKLKGTLFRQ